MPEFTELTPVSRQRLQQMATENQATLVGVRADKKVVFTLASGESITISLWRIRAHGWPTDLDHYLKRSAGLQKNAKGHLADLAQIAQAGGGELLDTQWCGMAAIYRFKHHTGVEFTMRAGSLKANGWPADLAARERRAALRRSEVPYRKTPAQLYAEFTALVEANQAVVLTSSWQGSRVPHAVRLRDGSVRKIKPNQLKNYGWPMEPLVELQKWARTNNLTLLTPTWTNPQGPYRFQLANGFQISGSTSAVRRLVKQGVHAQSDAALAWARAHGVVLKATTWQGLQATYPMELPGGPAVNLTLRAAMAGELINTPYDLATLRKRAKAHGVVLMSSTWNAEGVYHWRLPDGQVHTAGWSKVIQSVKAHDSLDALAQFGKSLGVELLSKTWSGSPAKYHWKMPDGAEIMATKYALIPLVQRHTRNSLALQELQQWGLGVGVQLQSNQWLGLKSAYVWKMPNGLEVVCAQSLLKRALNEVEGTVTGLTAPQVTLANVERIITRLGLLKPPGLIECPARGKAAGPHREKYKQVLEWAQSVSLELVETEWRGSTHKYTWRLPSGDLRVATCGQMRVHVLQGLRDYLSEVRVWCAETGVVLLSEWSHKSGVYLWQLPDGRRVTEKWLTLKRKLKASPTTKRL